MEEKGKMGLEKEEKEKVFSDGPRPDWNSEKENLPSLATYTSQPT